MKIVAAGRASEILDLGDGRVLRRFKAGGDPEREAFVMGHAAAHGYAVPHVHEVRSNALVLERIEGPTMLEDLWRRPWRLSRHAGSLARLHRELHKIPAPPELGDGRLLHMDLHPENVLLSPTGPVVIDVGECPRRRPRQGRRDVLGDRLDERWRPRPAVRSRLPDALRPRRDPAFSSGRRGAPHRRPQRDRRGARSSPLPPRR